MTIDLTEILKALIGLISIVITTFVIPLIRSKVTDQQYETLLKWAKAAVLAAEQLWPEKGCGEEKKEYVLNFLRGKGYDVNLEEVEIAIESCVKEYTKKLDK